MAVISKYFYGCLTVNKDKDKERFWPECTNIQHQSLSNDYIFLFQVKIKKMYSFLRLNHAVLPIKSP